MASLAERTETLRCIGVTPLLTTAQMMAYYGVSNWSINQWVKLGLPVEPTAFRGRRFDLAKCQAWHRAKAVESASSLASIT
ncbi:hypothetical protein [Streptomyces sp. NPDC088736]|uniref:hypothetical protein n=1 Tax=Streptomyces sp. NPDC088736 TaxID=3365881 RepID=UPI003826D6FA